MEIDISPGKLVANRPDRFGARLTSLVNARRLAQSYNLELAVYWTQGTGSVGVYNDPSETFSQEFIDEFFISKREWRRRQANAVNTANVWSMTSKKLIKKLQSGQNIRIEMDRGILCLADENPETVEVEFKNAFESIPRSPQLVELFESIGPMLNGATAYHIRRGDLVDGIIQKNRSWTGKFVPAEFYSFHMHRTFEQDANVILFSDEPETIGIYQTLFPKALSLRDVVGDVDVTEAGRDFAELYAMSRCAKIVAPATSAFSGAASNLSDVQLVSLIDDLPDAECDKMFEGLIEDLQALPDPNYSPGEVGQCLAHVAEYLEEKGEKRRAMNLFKVWIDRGLNLAHIYATAIEYFSDENDFVSVLEISDRVDNGYILFPNVQTHLNYFVSFAHLNLGDTDSAVFRAQSAVGSTFQHVGNTENLGAMLCTKVLNDSNFFPTDMRLLTQSGKSVGNSKSTFLNQKNLETRFTNYLYANSDVLEKRVTSLAPIMLDWAILLAPNLVQKKSGIRPILDAIQTRRKKVGNKPWMRSFEAMSELYFGNPILALTNLQEVYLNAPNALNAFRCSTAHWKNGQIYEALTFAEEAVGFSDAPAYKVWVVRCMMELERNEEALELLEASIGPLSGFATILELKAHLHRRLDDMESAKQVYAEIERIAPLAAGIRRQQARLLWDLGEHENALAAFADIYETQKMTAQGYVLFAQYLNEMGQSEKAAEVLIAGRLEFPTFDRLKEKVVQPVSVASRVKTGLLSLLRSGR